MQLFVNQPFSAVFTAAQNRSGWNEKQDATTYPGDGHVPGTRQHDDGQRRFALNGATYVGSGAIDGHASELQRRIVYHTVASRGRPGYQTGGNKTSKHCIKLYQKSKIGIGLQWSILPSPKMNFFLQNFLLCCKL